MCVISIAALRVSNTLNRLTHDLGSQFNDVGDNCNNMYMLLLKPRSTVAHEEVLPTKTC